MVTLEILRAPLRMRWRLKAVLPIVGVLLLGLIAFEIVFLALGIPNGHWILLVAAAGAVTICGVLLVVLVVLIERPLRDLEKTIARVRAGDLHAAVDFAKRNDDVGTLGKHFNEMVRQLRENEAEIERLHQREMARAEHLATLGEVAAGLAHEIRNPLAGIAGVVEVIGKELPAESASRAVLGEVQNEIGQIQAILTDLLAYARPRPPHSYVADLNATTEQTVLLARQQVRTKPIQILFAPDPGLPSIPHDPAQIQQVLLNLILNGIQSIAAGGEVRVSVRREENFAVVQVTDTGKGIPAEALSKIFRPFFTTRSEGTGLGLPLSKGIVEAHGGRIAVTSAIGRGSQFELWLPFEREERGRATSNPAAVTARVIE